MIQKSTPYLETLFDEKAAFVLDSGAFNRFHRNLNVVGRLRELFHRTPSSYRELNLLGRDIERESVHQCKLASFIGQRRNAFTTRGIVAELADYLRIIRQFKGAQDRLPKYLAEPVEYLRRGVSYLLTQCNTFAVPSGLRVIQDHQEKFNAYFRWLNQLAEYERQEKQKEDARILAKLRSLGDMKEYERKRIKMSHTPNRINDNYLIALSLVSAFNEPTILFSDDAGHVERPVKEMQGTFPIPKELEATRPQMPPHFYAIYIGSHAIWNMRVESKPLVS